MAIEILKRPQGEADAGMFNLPPSFDKTKFAAEWVEKGQVAFKQQRQNLVGCNATADGWTVWKADKMDEPTQVTGSGSKTFVLMCRPLDIQKKVNAMFGNVSKNNFNREVGGETVAGAAKQDPGILTETQLSPVIGRNPEKAELEENKV